MFFRWPRPAPRGSAAAKQLFIRLDQHIEVLNRKRMAAMITTMAEVREGWQTSLQENLAFVLHTTAVRQAIREAATHPPSRTELPLRFQVSSLFLGDCWKDLTSDPHGREKMHFISGPITADGLRVLSRIEQVTLDDQTSAYVRAEANETHKRVVNLVERDGHELLAMFHSHITRGADSTKPSATDIANQDRFVQIGWQAIGGIFSLDGYIRFFSTWKDFDLDLYGNGAELVTCAPREKVVKLAVQS